MGADHRYTGQMSGQNAKPPPTVAELFAELFRELTNLDSRVWRTLRTLVRPGAYAAEWQAGHRDHVFPPIRIYLIGSTLYFLAGGGILFSELVSRDLGEWFSDCQAGPIACRFLQDAAYTRTLGWIAIARILTLVPFALLLVLAWPRGAPRVAPAFVLSMNFYTIAFLFSTLSVMVWLPLHYWQSDWSAVIVGRNVMLLERILLLVWLILALRRVTSRSWLVCVLIGTVMALFDQWMLNFLVFGLVSGITQGLLSY